MRRVALTGGIATGKSHVARRLTAQHGVPVVDSDTIVHEGLGAGGALVDRVARRFGESMRLPDGSINRRALGEVIFSDPFARQALEALIHPYVYDRISAWFATLPPETPIAVADIPLLFETGRERAFDRVIVTACAPETQVERVMRRDGATREEAERRLAAQWPIATKIERADYVIATDGTEAETDRQVDALVTKLRN